MLIPTLVNLRPIIPSFLILVWLSAGEVWADYADPLPLENAILAYSADERGWAYDEVVTAYNRKGKISEVRATRVDPSRPWDQRELLISAEQGPATDRQKKKFQKGREKERRRIELGLEDRRRLRDRMNFPPFRHRRGE